VGSGPAVNVQIVALDRCQLVAVNRTAETSVFGVFLPAKPALTPCE